MAKLPVDPWFCRLLRCCALLAPIALGGAAAMAQSPPYGAPPVAAPGYGCRLRARPPPAQPIAPPSPAEDLVVQVQIQGNRAVSIEKILAQVHTRQGRPYDPEIIKEDVVRLQKMGTFVRVQSFSQRVPGGRIVIFRLIERPILQEVHIVGCVDYKEKALKRKSASRPATPPIPSRFRRDAPGWRTSITKKATTRSASPSSEGNKPGQLRAIYTINEGPKTRIWWVNVVGPGSSAPITSSGPCPRRSRLSSISSAGRPTSRKSTKTSTASPPITAASAIFRPASAANWNCSADQS